MRETCECAAPAAVSTVKTIPFEQMNQYTAKSFEMLARFADARTTVRQVHFTKQGGVFASTAVATDVSAHVDLRGSIGLLPVELTLDITVNGQQAVVKLQVKKPIHLGPYEWHFDIGAGGVALSEDSPAFSVAAAGSHFWCFLKCAGLKIAPILLTCLPALIPPGGVPAFVACVVGKAGDAAAGIAECVAECAG